ncbi:HhH-GPD-type base excision DNA repair protein [Propionibacteriaceae bacterium Y1700]|uniref:HhH-GPD-type base excision DNA repair protein n=1 Tax=Microlunatus sp. Y1700 TaxID=3418487 RepID=UPI003DA72273
MAADRTLWITGNDAADALLSTDPNALLLGMVLDQQDRLEKAFAGPYVIAERLGGELDVARIADMPTDDFVALCSQRPAIHRFPGSMAKRIQQVCRVLVDEYDGDAARIWNEASTGAEVRKAIGALPGFGAQKASIFTALLGKQYGLQADGWQEAAGDYGTDGHRSVADITDPDSLIKVRETKRRMKAEAKAAKDAKAD